MLPDDPNQQPGGPDETQPDLPTPDYSTRRLGAEEPQAQPPAEPEPSDYATRKLESDQSEAETYATRRIDPDQLFSALEPEPELPAPPAGPTRVIDEPAGSSAAAVFPPTSSTPDETPSPSSSSSFSLPPAPEPPHASGFTLPPTPAAPNAAGVPPAKKNNTGVWVAAIAAVAVVVICCMCACTIIALSVIASNSGAY